MQPKTVPFSTGSVCLSFGGALLCLLTAGAAFGQPVPAGPTAQPAAKAPWQRLLRGEEAKRVDQLEKQIDEARRNGRVEEAQTLARSAWEIRTRVQGEDHWQTADAK